MRGGNLQPGPEAIRPPLLGWYHQHHRVLPWRAVPGRRPPAYHVLVSEAMLQQTRVATVVPYFQRFIEAMPGVADLAAADEQRVLTLWQGLGYYRRARHLHAAARAVVEHHGGRIPDTVDDLLKLPGVGRYTAGAIASIAHGVPAPILDGNVARVLARLFAIPEPIDQAPTRRRLWDLAQKLVPADHPGDFNQAVMELGATLCTARAPRCVDCPVRGLCRAYAAGRVEQLPRVSPRKKPRAVTHHVLAIHRRGRYLLERRPETGLWPNMWQLPTGEEGPIDPLARFGLTVNRPTALPGFTHQTTHRTIRFQPRAAQVSRGRLRPHAGIWRPLDQLDDLPLSNPQRRLIQLLLDHPKPTRRAPP